MRKDLMSAVIVSALVALAGCKNAPEARQGEEAEAETPERNEPRAGEPSDAQPGQQDEVEAKTERDELADHGLVLVESQRSAQQTYEALVSAIEGHDKLSIMARVDHGQNAQGAGMELRPTYLVLFGNPKMGTPLMKESGSVGLDLPQRVVVFEDASGGVHIGYNDPHWLMKRHDIQGQGERADKIAEALEALAEGAATP